MSNHAQGTFELQSWEEDPYLELDGGGKLTRANVAQRFSGDLDGDGSVQWLMCYAEDGTARFSAFSISAGASASGQAVSSSRRRGPSTAGGRTGRWSVIPQSGTDGLRGIVGSGEFAAPHGPKADLELEYEFE